ncbi:rhodopsin [Methylobacterium indicum]|uniref:bacteriorhodopsin n=1 Tax=Methylobacterium indicum TaxID=1775910 RepID=UPI0007341D7B|nr:bacteriorhodopsin [Methylobacterium indicum]KTS38679.1 rhodopsin [Methylobacterium indicum]KTS42728.1 rhodopsin [Methylobacterium indicum]KTS52326.1 rhodopsin [Methylobacterium indicum]
MSPQFWLWVGFAGMSVGAALILFIGKRRTPAEEADTIIHGLVPIIAACSYFAMATGQGSILLPAGPDAGTATRAFYFARYIDWSFTTPLLLLGLANTAMHSGMRRRAVVGGMIGSDLIMIVTALVFGLSQLAWLKWTWFAISCGAFLAVYYGIFVQLREENASERDDTRADFMRNAVFLSVIWLAYPVVLLFGDDGLGLLGPALGLGIIAVLDLVAKVVYGLMATVQTAKRVDRDLAEGKDLARGKAAPVRPHVAAAE